MYAGKVTSKPVAKKKKHPSIQDKELLPLLVSARSAINFPEKTQNKVIFNLLKSHFKTLHNYRV